MANRSSFFILALYSALLSVFASLTLAYSLNLIYLIGDERQEIFLFSGLLLGSLFYSMLGSIRFRGIVTLSLIFSIVSYLLAFWIIFSNSMVIDNILLMITSFLITSPLMPSTAYIGKNLNSKLTTRISFSLITYVSFVIIILAFAIVYVKSLQTILPAGILIFAIFSVIISIFIRGW